MLIVRESLIQPPLSIHLKICPQSDKMALVVIFKIKTSLSPHLIIPGLWFPMQKSECVALTNLAIPKKHQFIPFTPRMERMFLINQQEANAKKSINTRILIFLRNAPPLTQV